MLRHIERIGRVCYKSEDKITNHSYNKFIAMLIHNKHGAMLEHGTVYLTIHAHPYGGTWEDLEQYYPSIYKYTKNKYSVINSEEINDELIEYYITTNYRVIVENDWLNDLQYWCEPTEYHERRHSVLFTTDRGVSHEFVRNRGSKGNAFAQESTRYCNYSKDKYNNEITFIIPNWCESLVEGIYDTKFPSGGILINGTEEVFLKLPDRRYVKHFLDCEYLYISLLEGGWKPQQARQVLPNALKTELVMTCYASDWKHFFSLRADKAAHPSAQELAYPLQEEFIKRKYINE